MAPLLLLPRLVPAVSCLYLGALWAALPWAAWHPGGWTWRGPSGTRQPPV